MIRHYYCMIKKGLAIPIPGSQKKAVIRKTFYIQLSPVEEGFVATSAVADIYEQEDTVDKAIRNYLYSLADELLWLDARQENVSASILAQLYSIQAYVGIV